MTVWSEDDHQTIHGVTAFGDTGLKKIPCRVMAIHLEGALLRSGVETLRLDMGVSMAREEIVAQRLSAYTLDKASDSYALRLRELESWLCIHTKKTFNMLGNGHT